MLSLHMLTLYGARYHPAGEDGDLFEPLERYFKDPLSLSDDELMPLFITFPSLKVYLHRLFH